MLKQTANDGLNIYEKHIYKFLKICAIGNKEHLLKQILIWNNYKIPYDNVN